MAAQTLPPPKDSKAAWSTFLEDVASAGAVLDGISRPEDAALANHALLHAVMLIGQGYALNVAADPARPRWVPNFHWPNSSLGNCPDTTYYYTPVEANGAYRIWGKRNSVHMVDFQIGEAFYGTESGGSNKALESLDLRDLPIDADGNFDFILSAERPADWTGEWRALPATAETITVRQVANDWTTEVEADLNIKRLDPFPSVPPSAETLAAKLRAIGVYAKLMAQFPFGTRLASHIRSRDLVNGGVDLITFGEAGGLADQCYYVGTFDLAPDEALIVEVEVPLPCRYWNIQLSDEMNGALDYIFRQSSLNGHQAVLDTDGLFRAVIAHRDPGVANWLDTGGVRSGLFMGRWKEAAAKPQTPVVRKVRLDEVATQLPGDTARVGADEREAIVEARRTAMLRRIGY